MAQYRAGRVTVTNGSDVVLGTDTDWLSNVATGDVFLVRGDEVPYRVAAVISNNELRLNARYAAPTESNTFYSITRDFTEYLNLPIIRNGDVDAVPLFAEGFILLDAKLRQGGGGGPVSLGALADVTTTGAIPGDQFTMLPSGSFGFVRPTPFTISFDHAPGDGARIFKSYTGGVVTARRIKVAGGTFNENADDITINIPPPGEANTLATAGSAQSESLVVAKTGTTLRTKGLRAGSGMTITPEGNDLVLAASGGGGTPISYTLAPVGTGVSLVAPASGTELRIKSLIHDSHFTVTGHVSGALSITLNKLAVTDIETVLWDTISPGQILTRNGAGQIVGTTPASPGITALAQDPAPKLGGPLDASGQRIIGSPVTFSGTIERPKVKSYIICLSAPVAMRLDSIITSTGMGTLNLRVDVGSAPESTPEEAPPSQIQGTAAVGRQNTVATTAIPVDPSQPIILSLSAISADIEDFTYTLIGTTV